MYDVITFGSSTVDTFAKVESELVKIKTPSYERDLLAYPVGSKILISDLSFLPGGGGTNTAVAMSKLGLKVGYVGKVGNDNNSKLILDTLKKENVDFLGVKAKGTSGYSIILDSLDGDRTILAYKGVNDTLDTKDVKLSKLKTKWVYSSSLVGRSYETMEKVVAYLKENNIKYAFNPSNYLCEKGKQYLKEILTRTELLILNKEESMILVGNHEIEEMIKMLMMLGPKMAVITDGKNGAYTSDGKYIYHVIPHNIKPTETTGAGDAFASTYLSGIITGKSIETCLKIGTINSESVITHKGAKMGLLDKKELLKQLKKNPLKVIRKKLTSGFIN